MPKSLLDPLPESVRNEVPGASPDFRTELAMRLADLVPEAVADGKIDVKKLADLLGDDAADESERFGLFWPGKKRALRAAQAPTSATLKPDFANSKNWDTTQNVFIEGDNLEVLKILQRHYHNKIKMIYIDPPYNTGKDFVYPDNFTEGLETYLEWTQQVNEEGKKVSTNSETEGRYHSNWLNMMYPRLKLARNLLTDDGIVFISIDDNEQDNLRKLCNEIFGEINFVANFIWNSSTGGGIRAKHVNISHQHILMYARSIANLGTLFAPLSPEAISQYRDKDEKGIYRDKDFAWKNAGSNPNQRYSIVAPDGEVISPKKGYLLRFVKERFSQELKNGNVKFKRSMTGPFVQPDGLQANWNIYIKKYLGDSEGAPISVLPRSLVGLNNDGTTEIQELFGERVFDFPKSARLMKYLFKVGANNDSIILDFFAGSSTTAHAVMQLNAEDGGNRRFIMVQLPEPTPEDSEARKAGFATIADISRKRIELAGQKISKGDTGFRAYKLTDTNFAKWRVTSEVTPTQLEQHLLDLRDSADDGASQDDLLAELLLKLGLSLTETIAAKTIAGLDVREIGDNRVLAYINEHIKPTLEQLRALVDAAPSKLIVLEDAFHGDDQLKTNLAQYAKTRGIELRTA